MVAVVLVAVLLIAVAVGRPFDGNMSPLFDRPEILAAAIGLSASLGWRLGIGAAGGRWVGAFGRGLAFGFLWVPLAGLVLALAGVVDAALRRVGNPLLELGPAVIWAVYGVAIFFLYGLVVALPFGIVWALFTHLLASARIRTGRHRTIRPTTRFVVAVLAISLATGAAQAVAFAPSNARCLDLDGGSATDAAFSPAGDLLAVTLRDDPNATGTVKLLRWPSGEVIDSWSAWVDDDVAVDPMGRVFWSAWVLGLATVDAAESGDGIYVVAPGSSPSLFVTGDERPLNDLTWTQSGLRGTTPNSHRIASIDLEGDHELRTESRPDDVGAFWVSSTNDVSVVGPGYSDTHAEIRSADEIRLIDVHTDPRSLALSSDRRTLVVASWFGGTRLVDTESGAARLVLRGSQVFVALSAKGDLAWANEEQFGHGRLCTLTLAQLL